MKEALKKYLEENLGVEKKKKSFSFPSLSFKIKNLFTEECDDDCFDEIQVEQIKKEVTKLPNEPREKSSSSVKYSINLEDSVEKSNINSEYLLEDNCIPSFLLKKEEKEMSQSDISTFIEQAEHYSDFQTLLFKMIDDRDLKDSDVYNKVHMDRRLFSKIRSNKDYHPSKETVLLLAFALELSESEMEQLLDSASYSLPRNNHYDLIIRFCFINKIYSIMYVNDLLADHNCQLFNY